MITKQEILNCARNMFNQKGYNQVSMRAIANNLNISVGNLTYHFNKKEDIFKALLEDNKLLQTTIEVKTISDLDFLFNEMLESLTKNHFYFTNDYLANIDEKLAINNQKNVQKQKNILIEAIEILQQEGYFIKDLSHNIIVSIITMIMLAHLEWVRELYHKANYPTIPKETFMRIHWDILYPYLTDKGKEELAIFCKLIK